MEKLSKKEIIKRHRKLWNKIAEIIERDDFNWNNYKQLDEELVDIDLIKRKALIELNEKYIPACKCWCCEYDSYFNDTCEQCPIEWSGGAGCGHIKSEYSYFMRSYLYEKKEETIMWAKRIAELPERKIEWECELNV